MQSKSNTVTAESLVQSARALVPKLKELAAQTDRARKMPDETVADMRPAGLFDVRKP